jgi:hypothetical protein
MKCPICGEKLVEGLGRRYETLDEHVSNPNAIPSLKPTYVCENPHYTYPLDNEETSCPFRNSVFWDYMGDHYILNDFRDTIREHEDFLKSLAHNHMFEARDSHARKTKIEIYEKNDITVFAFGKYRWKAMISYTADTDGNITNRHVRLQRMKKDEHSLVYNTPGWKMFIKNLSSFRDLLRRYRKSPNQWIEQEISKEFEPLPDWDKRLYRKFYKKCLHILYKNIEDKIKAKQLLQS